MDTDLTSHNVELYIYDLTQGMASMMSQMLLGRHLEGVWHTAVVVFGREFFYGAQGIQSCPPGGTVLGSPLKIEVIGETFIPYQVFKDYVRGLAESTFRGSNYSLLKHNCNSFTEDLCQFLCGTSIPKYILDLPQEFLSTPLGQTLGPLIDSIGAGHHGVNNFTFETDIREPSPGFLELNTEIDEIRLHSLELEERRKTIKDKLTKKEHKKKEKKSKKKSSKNSTNTTIIEMSEQIEVVNGGGGVGEVDDGASGGGGGNGPTIEMLPSDQAIEDDANEKREEEERKKKRDPPVVFNDIDVNNELEAVVKQLDGQLTKDEEQSMEELHQYLLEGEGSWALSENFLIFVGRILRDPNIKPDTRVHLLRTLAIAALKDDVILLLHQDRREHTLMNYAQDIDRHSLEEQQALALFMCNLFENTSSSEWLLYISEWTYNNSQISNIRITTKLSVHCLLSACPLLQNLGSAIIHNLACKEKLNQNSKLRQILPKGSRSKVFDDVAVELTMALLQFFSTKPNEEYLYRCLKALARFVYVSPDVPQLVQMIGPSPSTFRGASSRVDNLIDQISKKVR